MPKQRNSSFELIRILCIFFVVFWHSIGPYTNDLSTGNLVGSSFVNTLTNNTNLLFMMVSGYFGIRFNLEKLIKLDIAIIFYDLLHLFPLRRIRNQESDHRMYADHLQEPLVHFLLFCHHDPFRLFE